MCVNGYRLGTPHELPHEVRYDRFYVMLIVSPVSLVLLVLFSLVLVYCCIVLL